MIDVLCPDGRGRFGYYTRREPGSPYPSYDRIDIEERERVVLQGTKAGRSARELSHQLDITTRQITRIRNRLRERGEL